MDKLKRLGLFMSMSIRISPFYIILLCLQALAGSGQVISGVVLMKYLVDELIGEKRAEQLIFLGCLTVGINVFLHFVKKSLERTIEVGQQYLADKMNEAMAEKIMRIEYAYLENPYYLDLKERAVFAVRNQSALSWMIYAIAQAVQSGMSVAGFAVILFTLSPILAFFLVAGILLELLCYGRFSKYMIKFRNEILPVNRRYGYYFGLCCQNEPQKDARLYGMGDMLSKRVVEYGREIAQWLGRLKKRESVFRAQLSVLNDLQTALCYGYIGLRVITDRFGSRISLGAFTMYVSTALGFAKMVVSFGEQIVELSQFLSYLEPFAEFMALTEETSEKEGSIVFEGPVQTIEFDHVSFCYPGSDREVLTDVTFQVERGQKISVVGLNGAGKTTLVKLLCRLYKVKDGEIRINGRNIFDYTYTSYMKTVAAVFQDYKLFAFTLRENITGKEKEEKDMAAKERLENILEEVGLTEKIAELPDGAESLYGKEYEETGILMSGGESQKVAIARALYKDASLVIMDEPASALDPIAEAEIYEKFNRMVEDKTALYISHRMSSSVFCDKVLIIDGGVVADFDTHENLMKKTESLYYKMFSSQAVNYQL